MCSALWPPLRRGPQSRLGFQLTVPAFLARRWRRAAPWHRAETPNGSGTAHRWWSVVSTEVRTRRARLARARPAGRLPSCSVSSAIEGRRAGRGPTVLWHVPVRWLEVSQSNAPSASPPPPKWSSARSARRARGCRADDGPAMHTGGVPVWSRSTGTPSATPGVLWPDGIHAGPAGAALARLGGRQLRAGRRPGDPWTPTSATADEGGTATSGPSGPAGGPHPAPRGDPAGVSPPQAPTRRARPGGGGGEAISPGRRAARARRARRPR